MLELDLLLKCVMGSGVYINQQKRLDLANKLKGVDHGPLETVFPCDPILNGLTEDEIMEKHGYVYTYKFGLKEPAPHDRPFEFSNEDSFSEELEYGALGVLGFGRSGAVIN